MDSNVLAAIVILFGSIIGLVPVLLDWKKSKRERIAAEQERIHEASVKLLRNLANFRHLEQEDQTLAAGLPSHQQVTAEMRGSYDAWGLVVMPRLDVSQQERVEEIRKKELGRGNLKNTEAQDIAMSTEIFELTWTAIKNVK
jgi:predicted P-loop ATPase